MQSFMKLFRLIEREMLLANKKKRELKRTQRDSGKMGGGGGNDRGVFLDKETRTNFQQIAWLKAHLLSLLS